MNDYIIILLVAGIISVLVSRWLALRYMKRIAALDNTELQKIYDKVKKQRLRAIIILFICFAIWSFIAIKIAPIPDTGYFIYGAFVMTCGIIFTSGYYDTLRQKLVKKILENKNKNNE
jgi:hypothetical protein